MKRQLLLFLLSLGLLNNMEALLPPLYQSLNEYKKLLEDPTLTEKLQTGEIITSIERSDRVFIITTNKHTLEVNIILKTQNTPGPQQFTLEFEEPVPLYTDD